MKMETGSAGGNRAEQIRERLFGLGTDPQVGYTHKEIIERLVALENALLAGVYEKNHAENMRPQDLTKHFAALAEEFGLVQNETYQRFVANMDKLERTVKSYIVGQKGEKIAKSSLRPLAVEQSVQVLYNVFLDNGELKTEYDAIVIAPYGIFVIEVKNWFGEVALNPNGILSCRGNAIVNNLAARMVIKETLLRECLGELFPANYHSLLLFPEEKTVFRDEYHRIAYSYGAGIVNCIKDCSSDQPVLSDGQIAEIVEKIMADNREAHTFCDVRCNEIIEDFALLMAQMETASSEKEHATADTEEGLALSVKATLTFPEADVLLEKGKNFIQSVAWEKAGGIVAGLALALVSGVVIGKLASRK